MADAFEVGQVERNPLVLGQRNDEVAQEGAGVAGFDFVIDEMLSVLGGVGGLFTEAGEHSCGRDFAAEAVDGPSTGNRNHPCHGRAFVSSVARSVIPNLDHGLVDDFVDGPGIGHDFADDRGEDGAAPLVEFLESGLISVADGFKQLFLQRQALGEGLLRFFVVGFHKIDGNLHLASEVPCQNTEMTCESVLKKRNDKRQ